MSNVFNQVAALYDEARPGYPDQLIEGVVSLSAIPPGGSILEIGCGTGQATQPFARKGYSMLCLEPGDALARIAARNCFLYPHVEIQQITFEDWQPLRSAFDLVLSAQAFDWIPPEIGYLKAASVLKDSGSLALFWNHTPEVNMPFRQAVEEVFHTNAPQLMAYLPGKESLEDWVDQKKEQIETSGQFGNVTVKAYPWSEKYTTERYIKLLKTFSVISTLEESNRQQLLADLRDTANSFGGEVDSPHLSILFIAKKQ